MTDFIPWPGPTKNYVRLFDTLISEDAKVKVVVTASAKNAVSDTANDADVVGEVFPGPS